MFAQALFQCFGNIVAAHPGTDFEELRARMAQYLVAGLAAFPEAATFLEARDAFLRIIRLDGDVNYRHAVAPATGPIATGLP